MTDREQPPLRSSFDKVPEIYHAIRPGYPPMLFGALFELLPSRPHVLEVGPGTVQATKDLLAHGVLWTRSSSDRRWLGCSARCSQICASR